MTDRQARRRRPRNLSGRQSADANKQPQAKAKKPQAPTPGTNNAGNPFEYPEDPPPAVPPKSSNYRRGGKKERAPKRRRTVIKLAPITEVLDDKNQSAVQPPGRKRPRPGKRLIDRELPPLRINRRKVDDEYDEDWIDQDYDEYDEQDWDEQADYEYDEDWEEGDEDEYEDEESVDDDEHSPDVFTSVLAVGLIAFALWWAIFDQGLGGIPRRSDLVSSASAFFGNLIGSSSEVIRTKEFILANNVSDGTAILAHDTLENGQVNLQSTISPGTYRVNGVYSLIGKDEYFDETTGGVTGMFSLGAGESNIPVAAALTLSSDLNSDQCGTDATIYDYPFAESVGDPSFTLLPESPVIVDLPAEFQDSGLEGVAFGEYGTLTILIDEKKVGCGTIINVR